MSNVHLVFRDQPILCPWVTTQPYPSTESIKNKPNELVKNHGSALNNTSKLINDHCQLNAINFPETQSSSTHFFYFLRLMQLFPDTHPATLHTVLTLSRNNFFSAIDKLLYAKKHKSSSNRRQTFPIKSTRGRGSYSRMRGRQAYTRSQHHSPSSRSMSDDLAEVQKIIGLAEKPYLDVQPLSSTDNANILNEHQNINHSQQIVNICVDSTEQTIDDAFIDNESQEVIEIVCFENEHQIEDAKVHDSMEFQNFAEETTKSERNFKKEHDSEIIVLNELGVESDMAEDEPELNQSPCKLGDNIISENIKNDIN